MVSISNFGIILVMVGDIVMDGDGFEVIVMFVMIVLGGEPIQVIIIVIL